VFGTPAWHTVSQWCIALATNHGFFSTSHEIIGKWQVNAPAQSLEKLLRTLKDEESNVRSTATTVLASFARLDRLSWLKKAG
jgi:hypothetical protein